MQIKRKMNLLAGLMLTASISACALPLPVQAQAAALPASLTATLSESTSFGQQDEDAILRHIPAAAIGLPTRGATVTSATPVYQDGNIAYYAVRGSIQPVDAAAPAIQFQVNLPLNWNQKAVQFGGDGCDGTLVTATAQAVGQAKDDATPLQQGYVTFGSDGGHQDSGGDASWALNEEALHNFASDQLKKTKDVAFLLATNFYGQAPSYTYFIGGANGGREALMAAQRYPRDYAGVVAFYPLLDWVPKAIADHENAQAILSHRGKGWLSPQDYEKVKATVLKDVSLPVTQDRHGNYVAPDRKTLPEAIIPGITPSDGMIADPVLADMRKDFILADLKGQLSRRQLKVLQRYWEPQEFYSIDVANGFTQHQGYSVSQLLSDDGLNQFGSQAGATDGALMQFSDSVLRYQVLRDADARLDKFRPEDHRTKIHQASQLLDATSPELSAFKAYGGKLLLVHGTADQIAAVRGTTDYYTRLQAAFPKDIDTFVRYYCVPGYGHGHGSLFTLGHDFLQDIDQWRSQGIVPAAITVTDQNAATFGRTQVVEPYRIPTVKTAMEKK